MALHSKLGFVAADSEIKKRRMGPPPRRLSTELILATLIYVGALAASVLASMCLSGAVAALLPDGDEGSPFALLAIWICVGMLVNPAIFAAVAANHCRRLPVYYLPLTPVLWLGQFVILWRERLVFRYGPIAAAGCALAGLAFAYWTLGRKKRAFQSERELATSH